MWAVFSRYTLIRKRTILELNSAGHFVILAFANEDNSHSDDKGRNEETKEETLVLLELEHRPFRFYFSHAISYLICLRLAINSPCPS